jgi:hypothetical protein
MGCFADGDGPYETPPWGPRRTLPAALNTEGLTHEQCAQSAAQAGYEVYALQSHEYCFMGNLPDVAQMRTKLYDGKCSTTPDVQVGGIGCRGMVNNVYSIGAPSMCGLCHFHGSVQAHAVEREREI